MIKKMLLVLCAIIFAVSVQASNLLMGQSELAQFFPHSASVYFPFTGTHVGSSTATGNSLGYSTTITGLIVTSSPLPNTPVSIRLANLTTLQHNGIDPGSDFTTWPAGSSIGFNIASGSDGGSTNAQMTVASTDQLVMRIQAGNSDVTFFNHITWYIPQ